MEPIIALIVQEPASPGHVYIIITIYVQASRISGFIAIAAEVGVCIPRIVDQPRLQVCRFPPRQQCDNMKLRHALALSLIHI